MNCETKQLTFVMCKNFKSFFDERGALFAFDLLEEFSAKRAFLITCKKGNWRGGHYHKLTTQIILVFDGTINTKITNSLGEVEIGTMTVGTQYRHNPYTQFEFCAQTDEAKILVLCDTLYDPNDYYTDINQ